MVEAKADKKTFFIELYELDLRDQTVRIAACDEDITFRGEKFIGIPFKRGSITRSLDSIVNECEIELSDCSDEILSYLLQGFDFRGCSAMIARIKYPDSLTDPDLWGYVFGGVIDEPSFSNGVFTAKIVQNFPTIELPLREYRISCNAEFGNSECCANTGYDQLAIVAQNGNSITLPNNYPDNYWQFGSIKVGGEARVIISSHDNTIVTNINFLQDTAGKLAEMIRGCNKTFEWCQKYGNTKHYSGFPAIPWESEYR